MTVIEVGVWKGVSSSYIAGWLKRQGKGVLLSIDTWLGAPEFWGTKPMSGEDQERNLEINFGFPHVFYTFLSNIVHQGLEEAVIPLPLPSKLATIVVYSAGLYGAVDLIHVDAAHECVGVEAPLPTHHMPLNAYCADKQALPA